MRPAKTKRQGKPAVEIRAVRCRVPVLRTRSDSRTYSKLQLTRLPDFLLLSHPEPRSGPAIYESALASARGRMASGGMRDAVSRGTALEHAASRSRSGRAHS